MEKHPHAELIKQVVDGLAVPQANRAYGWWEGDLKTLMEHPEWEWRAKLAEPEKVYPVTQMPPKEMIKVAIDAGAGAEAEFLAVANAALRHAVDNGYLLTPEQAKKRCDESFQFGTDEALARMGQEYTAEHDQKIAQAVYFEAQLILDMRLHKAVNEVRKATLGELLERLPAIVKEVKP